jgi:hypothetical protein
VVKSIYVLSHIEMKLKNLICFTGKLPVKPSALPKSGSGGLIILDMMVTTHLFISNN